jgi:HSP20 family protein
MSLIVKKNGSLPSLLSDFFSPSSLLGKDFFESNLFPARLGINVPTVNVTETVKEFKLELAAPGLERNDFNVVVDNHVLTICAEKEEERSENEKEYSRKEYSFNSFSRSFSLPENVTETNIDAKYENGVLKVSIPKQKETPVKSSHKINVG